MNRRNKETIETIIDDTYLVQLEEMNYPVIKHTVLTQEEFNEELIAVFCEAAPADAQYNIYLEDLEAMGLPVVIVTQMSREEFNELLRSRYIDDDTADYLSLLTKKLLDNKDLAKVS